MNSVTAALDFGVFLFMQTIISLPMIWDRYEPTKH